MNKSYKFKKGDTVVSGDMAGTIVGIRLVGGKIMNLRVQLFYGGAIKYFNPEETKVIEFDSNKPSNEYLENVLKGKQEKPAEPIKKSKTKVLTIDELLDRYNDNKELYEQFGDKEYKCNMDQLILKLKLASDGIPVMETINED